MCVLYFFSSMANKLFRIAICSSPFSLSLLDSSRELPTTYYQLCAPTKDTRLDDLRRRKSRERPQIVQVTPPSQGTAKDFAIALLLAKLLLAVSSVNAITAKLLQRMWHIWKAQTRGALSQMIVTRWPWTPSQTPRPPQVSPPHLVLHRVVLVGML